MDGNGNIDLLAARAAQLAVLYNYDAGQIARALALEEMRRAELSQARHFIACLHDMLDTFVHEETNMDAAILAEDLLQRVKPIRDEYAKQHEASKAGSKMDRPTGEGL